MDSKIKNQLLKYGSATGVPKRSSTTKRKRKKQQELLADEESELELDSPNDADASLQRNARPTKVTKKK